MRFLVRLGERLRDAHSRGFERHLTPEPGGDFRGPYGFGRRAHRPDPNGHYVFRNEPEPRTRPDDPS